MSTMSTVSLFYTTFSSYEEALKVTTALLDKKLIACANIMPMGTSVYRWHDKVETSSEWPTLLKSQTSKFKEIESCIKELHSYDCPCIIELKVDNGADDFLAWIIKETKIGKN